MREAKFVVKWVVCNSLFQLKHPTHVPRLFAVCRTNRVIDSDTKTLADNPLFTSPLACIFVVTVKSWIYGEKIFFYGRLF